MKRVVPFLDICESIPDKAKYLFSKKTIVNSDAMSQTLYGDGITIAGLPGSDSSVELYVHYYEVDNIDFEALVNSEYFKQTYLQKMEAFVEEFKLTAK